MLRWLVLACVVVPSIASADPPPLPELTTQSAMENYFAGEKTGGFILMGMGAAGLATGGLLFFQKNRPVMKGASYPLLGIGVLHVAAGIFVYVASNKRIDDFTQQIEKDEQTFIATESKRMRGVSTQFTVLTIVECVLIAGGLTMVAVGHKTDRPRLKGAGLALAIEMGATLAFDVTAAARARDYRDELAANSTSSSLDSPAPGTVMLVHTGVF